MSTISAIQTNTTTSTSYTSNNNNTDTKSIEAQIASLTSDLANVASDDKLKDDEKEAKKMAIQSQIDALKAQLAKSSGTSESNSSNSVSSNTSQTQTLPKNALSNEDGDYFTNTEDEDTNSVQDEYSKSLQNVDNYKQMASLLVQSNNL